MPTHTTGDPAVLTPLTPYQKRLFVFLSVATFFEGYDFLALAQILPNLRRSMGIDPSGAGTMIAFINIGTILAYFLVARADAWGRRRVLTITIAGYTIFSLLSGLAPDVYFFAIAQLGARMFLVSEWAIATVYAAEEYPADRRGMVIGVIQGCASLGAITCAALVPVLLKTEFGWRSVYFVGSIPLIIIAFARRNLQETRRFTESKGDRSQPRSVWRILATPYAPRMFILSLAWALTYLCTQSAITFWKEFAVSERNMTDGEVGGALTIASLGSLPLVFLAGKLLDSAGRKLGALVIFTVTSIGVVGSYTLESRAALTAAMTFAIFGVSAVLPVLNAFTAELFPTELRSDAFAWANNLLGRIGFVVSPIIVGFAAEVVGWGTAVACTAIFPILAVILIWTLLPETKGRELEETARV